MKKKNADIVDGIFTNKSPSEEVKVTSNKPPESMDDQLKKLYEQYTNKASMAFELLKSMVQGNKDVLTHTPTTINSLINSVFDLTDNFQAVLDSRHGKAVSDLLDTVNTETVSKVSADNIKTIQ